MTAKVLTFGKRSRKAAVVMNEETRNDVVDMLLDIALRVENGDVSSIYVAWSDPDGKTDSHFTYHGERSNQVLSEVNWLRNDIIKRIRAEFEESPS